jgi:hypothetical protein
LFLLQWLHRVERGHITEEEQQFLTILRDLLFEASPSNKEKSLSARFLTVIYGVQTLHIWGRISKDEANSVAETFSKICRVVAEELSKDEEPLQITQGDNFSI